jgi:hypothetical protein
MPIQTAADARCLPAAGRLCSASPPAHFGSGHRLRRIGAHPVRTTRLTPILLGSPQRARPRFPTMPSSCMGCGGLSRGLLAFGKTSQYSPHGSVRQAFRRTARSCSRRAVAVTRTRRGPLRGGRRDTRRAPRATAQAPARRRSRPCPERASARPGRSVTSCPMSTGTQVSAAPRSCKGNGESNSRARSNTEGSMAQLPRPTRSRPPAGQANDGIGGRPAPVADGAAPNRAHPEGYGYSQFCARYQQWAGRVDLVMRHQHRGRGQAVRRLRRTHDYVGHTIPIYPPDAALLAGAAVRGGAGSETTSPTGAAAEQPSVLAVSRRRWPTSAQCHPEHIRPVDAALVEPLSCAVRGNSSRCGRPARPAAAWSIGATRPTCRCSRPFIQ